MNIAKKLFICLMLLLLVNCKPKTESEQSEEVLHSHKITSEMELVKKSVLPFDPNVTSLPKKYSGHDYFDVIQSLEKIPKIKKDEFETTNEYNKRKQAILSKPISLFGEITTDSLLAFKSTESEFTASYNADLKNLSINCQSPTLVSEKKFISLSNKDLSNSVFFGSSQVNQATMVAFLSFSSGVYLFDSGNFSMTVQPDVARNVKPHLQCLYIGRPSYPFVSKKYYFANGLQSETSPTLIDYPKFGDTTWAAEWKTTMHFNLEHIWIFDSETGEILWKSSASKQSGEQIVEAACSMCHTNSLMNAPKIGDKAAWKPRIAQGYDTLVNHAILGMRLMPARGGNPNLSDAEIEEAVVYMSNQSGANFKEP